MKATEQYGEWRESGRKYGIVYQVEDWSVRTHYAHYGRHFQKLADFSYFGQSALGGHFHVIKQFRGGGGARAHPPCPPPWLRGCSEIDGVAKGSPLGPTNICLCHYEEIWLKDCPPQFKPNFYKRYVDDIFTMPPSLPECIRTKWVIPNQYFADFVNTLRAFKALFLQHSIISFPQH